jgi:diaminohydroxyphosphoribosylaminopyrimidine deaminase/5-amino-6-(5-phosphoribosylamino)uracil reductase
MLDAKRYLDMAARAALRAQGDVEPNPLVGAAIVKDGDLLGLGHHRRFGGPHAEIEALSACRARGADPRGATMYVTLEPCHHRGKTPPCTEAIVKAGIARVVCARPDPNPVAAGGAEALRGAGIAVEFTDASPLARSISDPFVKRITTGLPWVIAKWAQTIDGYIADRDGDSKWISCEASRRRVHRLRARVDAIITAKGTVIADNPLLTARGVARLRRTARRVLIDRDLDLPIVEVVNSTKYKILETARQSPVLVCCRKSRHKENEASRARMEERGVEVIAVPCVSQTNDLDFHHILKLLADRYDVSTVLVEGGAGLLTRLFFYDLVDEAMVFVAPKVLNDGKALSPLGSGRPTPLSKAAPFRLHRLAPSGEDAMMVYRRAPPS